MCKHINYIGGRRSDLFAVKSIFNYKNSKNFIDNRINQIFYGRGYFALKAIFQALLKKKNKIILHCPAYNCWETLKLSLLSLQNISVKKYNSPEELKNNQIEGNNYLNCVLVIDYFGISDYEIYLKEIKDTSISIFDLAHTFPTNELIIKLTSRCNYVFTSLRKFLPVPDGSLIFTKSNQINSISPKKSTSLTWKILSISSYFKTIDRFLDKYGFRYKLFKILEQNLNSINGSIVSKNLVHSVDLDKMLKKRIENFKILYSQPFLNSNLFFLNFKIRKENLNPLYFPIKVRDTKKLQNSLVKKNIYCPIFWPENNPHQQVLGIPIDDRYNSKSMYKIVNLLEPYINHF